MRATLTYATWVGVAGCSCGACIFLICEGSVFKQRQGIKLLFEASQANRFQNATVPVRDHKEMGNICKHHSSFSECSALMNRYRIDKESIF